MLGIPTEPLKLALLQTLSRSVDHLDESANTTGESISFYLFSLRTTTDFTLALPPVFPTECWTG